MSYKAFADFKGRQKGLTIAKPFVYGNIARYFGTTREDGHTHQWTVFVKPYENEDMSAYVKEINFKLHGSYANSSRTVNTPPFQVTETGYGQFEIVITIYFRDPNEKPIIFKHLLRLHHSDPEIIAGRKNLVNEIYEEMIFQDPSSYMQTLLSHHRPIQLGHYFHENNFEEKKHKQLSAIQSTSKTITQAITQTGEQIKQIKDEIRNYKRAMGMLYEVESEQI